MFPSAAHPLGFCWLCFVVCTGLFTLLILVLPRRVGTQFPFFESLLGRATLLVWAGLLALPIMPSEGDTPLAFLGITFGVLTLANAALHVVVRCREPPTHTARRPAGEVEAYFSRPGEDCLERIVELLDGAQRTADICVFTITDNRLARYLSMCCSRGAC